MPVAARSGYAIAVTKPIGEKAGTVGDGWQI